MRVTYFPLGTKVQLKSTKKVSLKVESRNTALLHLSDAYVEDRDRQERLYKQGAAELDQWLKDNPDMADAHGYVWNNLKYLAKRREVLRPYAEVKLAEYYTVTLPKGEYTIDRIYIRRGSKDYDSITLRSKNTGRFFLSLDEFNKLGFVFAEK